MSSRSMLGRGWRAKRHQPARHARPVLDVPVELQPREYEFPTVTLPTSRPMIGRQVLAELAADLDEPLLPFERELLEHGVEPSPEAEAERAAYVRALERSLAAVADDDTLPLDDEPQAAPDEASAPVPSPTLFFLNAGAPQEPLHNGEQFDAGAEHFAPDAEPGHASEPPRPQQRDEQHPLVFSVFDAPFWRDRQEEMRRAEMTAANREEDTDAATQHLLTRLARLEHAHGAFIERVAAEEYRGRLADTIRPLPHRVPGAALAAIEAAEPVTA